MAQGQDTAFRSQAGRSRPGEVLSLPGARGCWDRPVGWYGTEVKSMGFGVKLNTWSSQVLEQVNPLTQVLFLHL